MIKIPQIGDIVMSPHAKVKDKNGDAVFDLLECDGTVLDVDKYTTLSANINPIIGNISNATYLASLDVTGQNTTPRGMAFNDTGTKLFLGGDTGDIVFQYTLSTPFDISTAVYDEISFSVVTQISQLYCILFSAPGTDMYALDRGVDRIYQYVLGTAFDITTAAYSSKSFGVGSQVSDPRGFTFNNDGSKLYVVGTTDIVFQYTLSTPFDISTAVYDEISFSVATQSKTTNGIAFNSTGKQLFVFSDFYNSFYQYTLETAFDIATASYSNNTLYVVDQTTAGYQIALSGDDSTINVVSWYGDIHQYSLPPTTYIVPILAPKDARVPYKIVADLT